MNQQMSQKQLLQWINMVSFAVNDITLYLDTHPDEEEALKTAIEMIESGLGE